MEKETLAKKIADTAVLHGDFTLRSGRKSTWYIDKYLFTTQPDILRALGEMFANKIPSSTTLLAGAELGGIPLVTTASLASGLPCIFIVNTRQSDINFFAITVPTRNTLLGGSQNCEKRYDSGTRKPVLGSAELWS